MKVVWLPLALDRASEIAVYIAHDSAAAAEKWINTVFAKTERLKKFPESGRIVPEINNNNFRRLIYDNYRIIYWIERTQVSILTIRHCRQILPSDDK